MERRTALGLMVVAVPGLAGCTLLGLGTPTTPPTTESPTDGPEGAPTGAAPPSPPTVDDATVEPYIAKGRVTYGDGRPIVGATVGISNTLSYNSKLVAQTDADGRFRIQIAETFITTWEAWGDASIEYHGQVYERALDLDGDTFSTTDGAVRDMTLKLSGPMTQRGPSWVHGDTVNFLCPSESPGYVSDLTTIEVTLVPTGPLLDGSTGETIVRRLDASRIEDIPVGEYEFTVAHHAPDGTVTPLQVSDDYDGDLVDSLTEVLPAKDELTIWYFVPEELDTSD